MEREKKLINWVSSLYPNQPFNLHFAAADADFRKYYRAVFNHRPTIILMDAPPDKLSIKPFIKIQQLFQSIHVPQIYHINDINGFIALEDFGDNTFIKLMLSNTAPSFHKKLLLRGIDVLIELQQATQPNQLPDYDRTLLTNEMNLFTQWCLPYVFNTTLSEAQNKIWQHAVETLLSSILNQANVYTHRDFIIRNLMLTDKDEVGVIDFQDAVYGPISYDLASLTRDAFISWDEELTLDIVIRYWEKARKSNLPVAANFDEFYKQYEWMAVQRHLKVAGIFTRLNYRDGKDKYLSEIPRFITYLKKTTKRYHELHPLYNLLTQLTGSDTVTEFTF